MERRGSRALDPDLGYASIRTETDDAYPPLVAKICRRRSTGGASHCTGRDGAGHSAGAGDAGMAAGEPAPTLQ